MQTSKLKNKIINEIADIKNSAFLENILNDIESFKTGDLDRFELTQTQLEELDQRRKDYLKNPEKSSTWEEVKSELFSKHGL